MLKRTLVAAALITLTALSVVADGERQTTESGLAYTVLAPGDGEPPADGDRVTFHYEARLADGTVFGSTRTRNRPFRARVDAKWLIPGLYEGLLLMNPGSTVRLEIPATLAYGEQGKLARERGAPPIVPPNTDLVYDVELVSVLRGPKFHTPAEADWIRMDPGLRYAVLTPGSGEPPKGTQRVQLRIALWNDNKELVLSTFGQGKELDGQLSMLQLADKGSRESMLRRIVAAMKPGERVWIEATAPHTWGARPAHPGIKPNSATYWELELLEVSEIPSFEAPVAADQEQTKSRLKYEVLRRGDGRKARAGRSNEVHYVGWLPDGTLFDTSFTTGKTFRTKLEQVIQGWKEGVALMREGDIFRFEVPGHLGYGPQGAPPSIGPNATLVFWVELKKVW